MGDLVDVRGLVRRFGEREVIRGLDLQLSAGARIALVGPNGSGKTTLLRCIAGTLTPDGGEIRIGGEPAGTLAARRLVGVSLSQERSFYLRLSGRTNLRFFARLRHTRWSDALGEVAELEEELELAEIASRRTDACSTGMLQQLAFARALLGRPSVVLLDEPTRSLDEQAIGRIWAALDRRPEIAVLIATHRHGDLDRCDSRVDFPH
jgi:ABC-type multidrug transport system ATPase subunit